jgi:hypothetical protein
VPKPSDGSAPRLEGAASEGAPVCSRSVTFYDLRRNLTAKTLEHQRHGDSRCWLTTTMSGCRETLPRNDSAEWICLKLFSRCALGLHDFDSTAFRENRRGS